MSSLRGRKHDPLKVLGVRVLKPEDLEFLRQKSATPTIKRIRDSHHMVARLIAVGLSFIEIAERTGYTPVRVSMLSRDPSMQDLIASYRDIVTKSVIAEGLEIVAMKNSLTIQGLRKLQDRFDEDDEAAEAGAEPGEGHRLRDRDLLTVTSDLLDRTGHGKVSTNVNVNMNFAARLEAARRRALTGSAGAGATIDGTINPVPQPKVA